MAGQTRTATGRGAALAARIGSGRRPFWRDETGATAIEFAFVALPFFGLILGLADLGVYMFHERMAKAGVTEFTRKVRTGQLKDNLTTAEIKRCICASPYMNSFSCDEMKIGMVRVSTFGPPGRPPRDSETNEVDDSGFSISQPQPGEIVNVAAYIPTTRLTAMGQPADSHIDGSRWMVIARSSFRAEPFRPNDVVFDEAAEAAWQAENAKRAQKRAAREDAGLPPDPANDQDPNSPNGECQEYRDDFSTTGT